jgi:hypothetical protein
MEKIFNDGERVLTPAGLATVIYHKMSNCKPGVAYYAVKLDIAPEWEKVNNLYPPEKVKSI